ncbi:colicin V production CvpA [Gemmobacter aquarius]|uniref:Colicin V production CvpA n=1 Tax=Paragemmobacter aquarius TaxID=2169400 RepID=A0A2S0ULR2_9RHOB|nr:CvpA family protein [Gemmobacter aquarius]AWB48748.1 colicin V production CvpA [Gemmobacter aquarius]
MEGFTLVDAVVAGVIILSAILAYARGLVREGMAIVGWIGAAVVAFIFAASVQPLVKELPMVGKFLADSCELSIVAAFALVFAVALIVASLFTPLLSSAIHRTVLGGIDQGLGFLFGAVRGVLLVAVAFIVYDRALTSEAIPMVDDSRSAKIFASMQDQVNAQIPTDAPGWIVERYNELTQVCVGTATEAEPAPAAAPAN